jgi:large subunit ribosomal protein L36e
MHIDMRYGVNHGHPTTPIEKVVRPSQRKGVQSTKTKFVRSVIREVAGFSAYERRVMELLRNSKVRLISSVCDVSDINTLSRIRKLGS